MGESPEAIFDRLVSAGPLERPEPLFGTACVMGGSIAGLLAARVLAGHAERVVIIERYTGGQKQASGASRHVILQASRAYLEAHIRAEVLALPNVSVLRSQVTGLDIQGDAVRGVRHRHGDTTELLPADIVVDAMGRSSRLADWVSEDGFDRPGLERLPTVINYATALFKRPPQAAEEMAHLYAVSRYNPPYGPDSIAVAGVIATENDRWTMVLMTYGHARPGQTVDAFRATCAKLPSPLFAEAASQGLAEEIATYHQGDTRRRDFTGLRHFPARLVSMGDAVASFSPIYGQGISSAALHASCLSEYLSGRPDLDLPAARFFELQRVVVDAAWAVSAEVDAARLDALSGASVPEEVSRKRQAMGQIARASLVDAYVGSRFLDVAVMLAHPSTLADPALLERAIAVNQG